jgi:hypothetical protein
MVAGAPPATGWQTSATTWLHARLDPKVCGAPARSVLVLRAAPAVRVGAWLRFGVLYPAYRDAAWLEWPGADEEPADRDRILRAATDYVQHVRRPLVVVATDPELMPAPSALLFLARLVAQLEVWERTGRRARVALVVLSTAVSRWAAPAGSLARTPDDPALDWREVVVRDLSPVPTVTAIGWLRLHSLAATVGWDEALLRRVLAERGGDPHAVLAELAAGWRPPADPSAFEVEECTVSPHLAQAADFLLRRSTYESTPLHAIVGGLDRTAADDLATHLHWNIPRMLPSDLDAVTDYWDRASALDTQALRGDECYDEVAAEKDAWLATVLPAALLIQQHSGAQTRSLDYGGLSRLRSARTAASAGCRAAATAKAQRRWCVCPRAVLIDSMPPLATDLDPDERTTAMMWSAAARKVLTLAPIPEDAGPPPTEGPKPWTRALMGREEAALWRRMVRSDGGGGGDEEELGAEPVPRKRAAPGARSTPTSTPTAAKRELPKAPTPPTAATKLTPSQQTKIDDMFRRQAAARSKLKS